VGGGIILRSVKVGKRNKYGKWHKTNFIYGMLQIVSGLNKKPSVDLLDLWIARKRVRSLLS
jgi:hypothetical protein